jgi:cytochrome c553
MIDCQKLWRGSSRVRRTGSLLFALGLVAASAAEAQDAKPSVPQAKVEYNRDIRPILSDMCFACHGFDSAARKADLKLHLRDAAIEKKAIVPGQPDESELLLRILSTDPNEVMPPPASKKVVTDAQKDMLRRWIAEGAEYQPHWSYIAPTRAALPAVKNEAWVKNPIDRFILARLEAEGLTPAEEADRRTLARRVALDLTGLPPKPEWVEGFVADRAPNAYEKYVDLLLEQPTWGEHRGRHWLDYARYADTHGIHFDNYREMWSYRDWVIGAFNRNLPFDQFTTEQLAGDLLPDRTLDQQIASGFNRCNITSAEGGMIAEEYLVLYARDRTETASTVFMGLTTGCAVCHDHKFDPVTQKEFYELSAFFNNTSQGASDGNVKDTPPIVVVPQMADRERFAAANSELAAARTAVEQRKQAARPEFDTWLASATPEVFTSKLPVEGLVLTAPFSEGEGKVAKVTVAGQAREIPLTEKAGWQEGRVTPKGALLEGQACEIADVGDFEKDQGFSLSAWIKLPATDGPGAICARMDDGSDYRGWDFWVQGRRVGMHIINTWSNDALKVVSKAQVPANEWTHVAVTYDGSGKAAGVKVFINGKNEATNVEADTLKSTIKTTVPFKVGQRHAGSPISAAGLQDLRIYAKTLAPGEVDALASSTRYAALLAKKPEERTDAEKNDLFGWWLLTLDVAHKEGTAKVATLDQEVNAIKARGTIAHVMAEKAEPASAYVLFRGDYDKRRDQVFPKTPEVLPPFSADLPKNRLGLAKWLLAAENPLMARVTVNRFWQEVFGTGIVRTAGDLGVSGELPSHQELLDWLAVEFRETGWDTKKFFKLMVMSATYRQSAKATPEKLFKDPSNRLLARGPRFRMDAEMVRDGALATSGLLVPKIGGPSVRPYMPEGVWEAVAMLGSNTRDYRPDTGEGLYRRSMYTIWKRSAPPASMDIFNAPARELCSVRRERTNTPLQALVTLNDTQFIEAARHLAQRAILEGGENDGARLDFLARRVLSRPFRPEEMSIVIPSLGDLRAHYAANVDDAKKLISHGESKADPNVDPALLAAWTMLTNELMNLDEVLCK